MEVAECVGATGGVLCSTLTATTTRGSTACTPTDHSQLMASSGDTVSLHDRQKEGDHLCYFLGVWLGDFCVKVVELYVQHACCSDHVFLYSLSFFYNDCSCTYF